MAAVADAVDVGVDIVVLPELVTSGYVFESTDEARACAITPDHPVFAPVGRIRSVAAGTPARRRRVRRARHRRQPLQQRRRGHRRRRGGRLPQDASLGSREAVVPSRVTIARP